MASFNESRDTVLDRLSTQPAERPVSDNSGFGRVVAVYLDGALSAQDAALAHAKLCESGLMEALPLLEADASSIESAMGLPARKAAATASQLQRLAGWYLDHADATPTRSPGELRESLLSLPGIGAATVDAVLLWGLGEPSYPVDRATYRILVRHGWLDRESGYDEARILIVDGCAHDTRKLARLSAGFASIGREFCRPRSARCEACPLRHLLPDCGPLEGDE
jgi:endonuclease-3 related protein